MFAISIALVFCWQPGFSHKTDHAIYLSVVEISQNEKKDRASVRIKVFINDIEDAVFNQVKKRINLLDTASFSSQKAFLEKYFENHFELSLNGKAMQLILVSSELNSDAIWLQFETQCEDKWKSISVKADYLMELFPAQSNVLSIIYDNKKQFARLTNSKSSEIFKF